MKRDPKGMAAMLVAKMPKPSKEGEGAEGDYDGKAACAEDMMRAMQEGDAASFAKALDSYLDHR
jgi:L-arabinose isomerase